MHSPILVRHIAGARFGDYEAGFRFGQVGYDLVEQRWLKRFEAQDYYVFRGSSRPVDEARPAGRDLHPARVRPATRVGDLTFAAYSCRQLPTNLLAAGDPLTEVQREAENGLEFVQKAQFGSSSTSS